MVRLKVKGIRGPTVSWGKFQFHSGSIKRKSGGAFKASEASFQFHSGSIKRKVGVLETAAEIMFQFHSGSIKRRCQQCGAVAERKSFNSIVVRLKGGTTASKGEGAMKGFNSIVVRLKVRLHGRCCLHLGAFQFHSGSIKRTRLGAGWSRTGGFNSIVVRLKV